MAKRKYTKRSRKRPFPLGKTFLWTVLVLQSIWLAAFIWSTGSPLPQGVKEWASDRRQEKIDDEKIQEMLDRQGSKGPDNLPDTP